LQGKISGRPKGKKDSKPRRKLGYILRHAKEHKAIDEKNGKYQATETYLN